MANIIDKLKSIFKITSIKTNDVSNVNTLYPGTVNKSGNLKKVKFPDELQKLYSYWLKDSFETSETLKNRINRYTDLSYAYYNNSIFSKSVNLYADEAVQGEEGSEVLIADAKDTKLKKYIVNFLNELDINNAQKLNNIAFNLVLYGDAFQVNSIDMKNRKSIIDITTVDVFDIGARLEFNASRIGKEIRQNSKWQSFLNSNNRIKALSQILNNMNKDGEDYSQYFKNYLFGYWLSGEIYLPPWNVNHYRVFTTISEFAPYGRPIMINSLAPFRQLQAGKNLMALARASNFPIKKFSVKVDENMDQGDQWETVNELREDYHNLGYDPTDSEQFSMNSEIWVPENLIDVELIEPRMNLDDIADIEMLRDELIMATDIPKGYLIVDRSSFGTSGQSLLRQHKPFARSVYKIQTAMLEQISQLIRMQFVISGSYDYDTPFELSMPFPEIEESSDRLRMKNDTLRLAKDILDNIKDAIGLDRNESLPPEVVKDVFSQISFLDDEDINSWVDKINQSKDSGDDNKDGGGRGGFYGSKKFVNSNKLKERLNKKLIEDCAYEVRSQQIKENIANSRHHYSSYNITSDQRLQLELLGLPDNINSKELKEKLF